MSGSIAENLQKVRQDIAGFAQKYQRDVNNVTLLAVSKTWPAEAVHEAWKEGQMAFGENYLQEALEKIGTLESLPINWHFIGPIQSNKTRAIAEHFQWVHSVDREKIARRLSEKRPPELPPLKILLQVNLSGEASKSGVSPNALPELARSVAELPHLELRGLMSIPAPGNDFEHQRQTFRRLAEARDNLLAMGLSSCQELSMGMSQDYEAAIAEGATIIRIGTAIFGRRPGRL